VIITGGPQYRGGSHRLFVSLARSLAGSGFAVLRFDYRGMGDSSGDQRTFEDVSPDVGAALDAFAAAVPEVRRFVLWGLCDGASASLLYLRDRHDFRVAGLALLNPWVRTEAGEARSRIKHYYLKRVRERDFWVRLGTGKVAWKAARALLGSLAAHFSRNRHVSVAALDYTERMASAWRHFRGPVLLMLCDHDRVAREFEHLVDTHPPWQDALAAFPPQRVDIIGADHTCAPMGAKAQVEAATLSWLMALCNRS